IPEHAVLNTCGVIITTNHKTDGIYFPADDRRHFVCWSELTKEDFQDDYFIRLYAYYEDGGNEAVTAFLHEREISRFDPKAPPPKPPAFWAVADAYTPSEESDLADLIEAMGNPDAFTLATLAHTVNNLASVDSGFADWLKDRKNRRLIPHRL